MNLHVISTNYALVIVILLIVFSYHNTLEYHCIIFHIISKYNLVSKILNRPFNQGTDCD